MCSVCCNLEMPEFRNKIEMPVFVLVTPNIFIPFLPEYCYDNMENANYRKRFEIIVL